MESLRTGISLERRFRVGYELTAAALCERDSPEVVLPAVWSTPDMIAKMEVVSAALVAPHLDPGQMTVGSRNEVTHLAATPVGMGVLIRTTLAQVEGKKLTFAVEAFDDAEKVGEGIHVRFVVDRAKFERRVAEKG